MKNIVLLFLIFFSINCSLTSKDRLYEALEDPPHFDKQMLFKGGRFPNIVVAKDGSIIVTWGKENCVSRRSIDGGNSWEPEVNIGSGINGGGLTVDENSGEVIAFVEKEHPPSLLKCFRSKDNGKTWNSDPIASGLPTNYIKILFLDKENLNIQKGFILGERGYMLKWNG